MRTLIKSGLRLAILGILAAVGGALFAKSRMISRGEPEDDTVDLVAIFEGFEFESRAAAFRGGTLLAWFGGGTLDLREATLDAGGAHLVVRALFGGAQLIVPDDWEVDTQIQAIFGGAGDMRAAPTAGAASLDRPRLVIEGMAVFGGVGILSEARGPNGR